MTAIRVLYVDDEPDIREIATLALGLDPQLEVISAGSGREAIERAPEVAPDVILLDVMMPELDGPATLIKLREMPQTAKTPVIFVTARTQAHEVDRFVGLGAIGIIAKPFDPMRLAEEMRAILTRAAVA